MIEIKDMKRKVKIEIEYSKASDLLGFVIINEEDLKQLVLNVWLKNGERIYHKDIKKITIKKANTSSPLKDNSVSNTKPSQELSCYDYEKLRDIRDLTKEEFLKSYSYLTEKEYNEFQKDLKELKKKLKTLKYRCPKCSAGVILRSNFNNVLTCPVSKGYFAFCFNCDKDFYKFEIKLKNDK